MKNALRQQLNDCKKELKDIRGITNKMPLSLQTKYLTLYALIKACGTIENVFKSIVADYFDKSKINQVKHHIDKTVRSSNNNPSYDNICKLLKEFDDTWANDFKNEVSNHPNKDKLRSSINSLVKNRHVFAHGGNPTVSLSDILIYFGDAVIVLKILDKIVR